MARNDGAPAVPSAPPSAPPVVTVSRGSVRLVSSGGAGAGNGNGKERRVEVDGVLGTVGKP